MQGVNTSDRPTSQQGRGSLSVALPCAHIPFADLAVIGQIFPQGKHTILMSVDIASSEYGGIAQSRLSAYVYNRSNTKRVQMDLQRWLTSTA